MGEDSSVNNENKKTEESTNNEPVEDNAELVRLHSLFICFLINYIYNSIPFLRKIIIYFIPFHAIN